MYKKALIFLSNKVEKMKDLYPTINVENFKENEYIMKLLYIIFIIYSFLLNIIIIVLDFFINLLSGFQISRWENDMALKEISNIQKSIHNMYSEKK